MFESLYIIHQNFEALVEMAETEHVWPGQSADDRLRNAHVEFTKLCRQHKVRTLEQFGFTKIDA